MYMYCHKDFKFYVLLLLRTFLFLMLPFCFEGNYCGSYKKAYFVKQFGRYLKDKNEGGWSSLHDEQACIQACLNGSTQVKNPVPCRSVDFIWGKDNHKKTGPYSCHWSCQNKDSPGAVLDMDEPATNYLQLYCASKFSLSTRTSEMDACS